MQAFLALETHRCAVQTIETAELTEARRCRFAQYRGQKARLILNGVPVTGMIRAVKEDKSSTPMRWTVTVVKLASYRTFR